MVGNLVLLAVSWVLLRLEGKGLGELGFNRPALRFGQLATAMGVAGAAAALQQFGYALANDTSWSLNPDLSGELLIESLRWNANSVLFEELIFRGYLLYQAIRFLGKLRGVLLAAAAFGVYHWFTFGALGNPGAMLFVFLYTGMYGWMFSIAFAETRSLAAPVGLHLGWNLVTNVMFSAGPLGATLLVPANGAARLQAEGGAGLGLGIVLPVVLVGIVSWYLMRARTPKPADVPPHSIAR